MTRTDDEHELILGNKQLLSAFFVVAILLGVFFTMGYFVGRNTATGGQPGGAAQTASSAASSVASGGTRPDAASRPLESQASGSPSAAPDSTVPVSDGTSAGPPEEARKPPAKAEPDRPIESARPVESEKPEPRRPERVVQPSAEEMYLQVFALRRSDAEQQVKVLREGNFPALLGESSKPGIYRVLVGPFKTMNEMGRMKADLKAKGFDSIVAK